MKQFTHAILYGVVVYILFFSGLGAVGLVGPDEPRYADVARHMFLSGDYITPRLFGQPWFEKPPLYYWLAALAFRQRVDEVGARVPSAAAAALFVGLWFWFADRFYGTRAAQFSCLMLAGCVGWIGFARAAAMDMLLATNLSAALIFLAFALWEEKRAGLYGFYAMLGVATLAKGPLAVGLAGLIVLGYVVHRRDWKDVRRILWPPAVALFAAVSVPWYWLCYSRNGFAFIQEFFVHQNWQRMISSEAIGHPQPAWFYLLVLLGALFPWTPLLVLPFRELAGRGWRGIMDNPRNVFLFYWIVLPLAFFSLAQNKLPGYLLPVLPPVTLCIGCCLAGDADQANKGNNGASERSAALPRYLVGASALLLLTLPWIGGLLPEALSTGVTQALGRATPTSFLQPFKSGPVPDSFWLMLAVLVIAGFYFLWRGKLLNAAAMTLLAVTVSVLAICYYVSPSINRVASVRSVALQVQDYNIGPADFAVFHLERDQVYGLGFYLGELPLEWQPNDPTQHAGLVAARSDLRLQQFKPGYESLALFPGQHVMLWGLNGWP